MRIDFPNSPTLNQVFSASDGRSWSWDGSVWNTVSFAINGTQTTSPITNTGDQYSPVIGLDESLIEINKSQVLGLEDSELLSLMGAI